MITKEEIESARKVFNEWKNSGDINFLSWIDYQLSTGNNPVATDTANYCVTGPLLPSIAPLSFESVAPQNENPKEVDDIRDLLYSIERWYGVDAEKEAFFWQIIEKYADSMVEKLIPSAPPFA
ncbi:hypothetical protein LZD49_28525 [Dyadobacter sp. CY261]|uniref:hypothetical protein n=1 Tax=Dyadobacter sp. CY261 TaxID=2907203 RepID=UPI001F1DC99C|nr:hypothetical protein [Dyadobacter sp. CY261]MCF0074464.1 hypothetical protein [Dyadobacter sp. CY261]